MTTMTYHPQTNGQTERYNLTLTSCLRHYITDHLDKWDNHVQTLTFAYNTQPHKSTGLSPFSLTLSSHPPSPLRQTVSGMSRSDMDLPPTARATRIRLLENHRELFRTAGDKSGIARDAYKAYFDKGVRMKPKFRTDEWVFVERPSINTRTEAERMADAPRTKLLPKSTGPCRILAANPQTVTIDEDGCRVTVSIDRCRAVKHVYNDGMNRRKNGESSCIIEEVQTETGHDGPTDITYINRDDTPTFQDTPDTDEAETKSQPIQSVSNSTAARRRGLPRGRRNSS